jgi:DNA-directed RNA polymerase subunit RPC12/RpoP
VTLRKLEIACPGCGSKQVFYTCNPGCCYNHVCGDCGTTFEPVTRKAGGALTGITPPEPPADASDPTAACARCDSNLVCMTDEGAVVCASCGALLVLELTEVHSG